MSFTVDSVDNVNTKQMARERKKIIIYDTTDTRKKEYEREREKKIVYTNQTFKLFIYF